MVKIAPSILSADFGNLASDIKEAEEGGADMVHIDVMDGNFVSNITIGPVVIAGVRNVTKLPFDVHLMINNPEKYIHDYVKAGSDILTVHAEASDHLHGVIQKIKKQDIKAGVALNPSTPISVIENVMGDIDMVVKEREPGSSLDPSAEPGTNMTTKIGFDLTKPLRATGFDKALFPEIDLGKYVKE